MTYPGITEYLIDKDPTLKLLSEPSNSKYRCFNTGGVEVEVGEFLYGLVRMIKPEQIFETGTHWGISSSYMGLALKDNGFGTLTTIDIFKDNLGKSRERWKALDISNYIYCDREKSLEYDLGFDVDLLFLDSEPELRFKELRRFYPRVKQGGYIFIHDLSRDFCQGNINTDHPEVKSWPFGDLPKEIKEWVWDNELVPFIFNNPRGLVGFYKTRPDDYKWERNK